MSKLFDVMDVLKIIIVSTISGHVWNQVTLARFSLLRFSRDVTLK